MQNVCYLKYKSNITGYMTDLGKIPVGSLLERFLSLDKQSTLRESVAQSTLDAMAVLEKENISRNDRLTAFKIVIGCWKLMAERKVDVSSMKSQANIRDSMKTVAILSIVAQLSNSENEVSYRPFDFKKNLPDDIKSKISVEDLTEALHSLIGLGRLSHSANRGKIEKKKGKISSAGVDDIVPSGPNSRYVINRSLRNIERVIEIPAVRKLIFELILESGLLHKFIYTNMLTGLIFLRMKAPLELERIRKERERHAGKTPSIDETYNMYNFLNRLDNKRLKKIALELMSTVQWMITYDYPAMLEFYKAGGLDYYRILQLD